MRKKYYCENSVRAWLLMLKTVEIVKDELRRMDGLQKNGVSLGQMGLMINLIIASKPLSQVELSKRLLVSKGNITAVIRTLEKNRLVKRAPDLKDGRKKLLSLTEKGRRIMSGIFIEMDRTITDLFKNCRQKKIKALSDDLTALLACFPNGSEITKDIQFRINAVKRLERNS